MFIIVVSLLISLNKSNTFANVYFVEFEQVNAYLPKFDVCSLKLFDSCILIYCDCVRGMVTRRKQNFKFKFNVQLFSKSKLCSLMFYISTSV